MKRITTVLKESERKAVCIAGAERIMITPIPYRICGVDMIDIYSEKRMVELDKQVRLDVPTDNSQSGRIVSAIRKIAHAGKIGLASLHGRRSKSAA